ncbi:DUF3046 domain-containing protein [Actinomyces timonensis]|uniref:DUF3046 domain-containing protein n=1 Tax=Actinomyces timonensis TaxID=1288391 RepID=A0AAU8MZP7_9ACTO
MKHSEFWRALDEVFGSAYGRSLAQDLVLPPWSTTAVQALDAGEPPREVWDSLCQETERSEAERWVYRDDPRARRG